MNALLIAELLRGIVSVGDQLIEDKDKKAEFASEVAKLHAELIGKLVSTPTVPWVDALVKLIYTLGDVGLKWLRPVGGIALTGVGVYLHLKGIAIPEYMQAALDMAFPGWMLSRHLEKARSG